MEDAIILYPSPVIGHLISMVEFGKLILTHSPSLSINILITPQTYNAGSSASYMPQIPSADMPNPLQDRNDKAYKGFLNSSINMPKSAEIIVNTFESLEPRALKAIMDGLCVLDDEITLLLYCIGPLVAANINGTGGNGDGASNKCLTWMDLQPSRNVVFFCSGSTGFFSAKQLKEIAVGLERSGKGFLWVVRSPPSEED